MHAVCYRLPSSWARAACSESGWSANQALQDGVRGVGLPLLVQQAGVHQQPFGAVGQVGMARQRLQPAQGARALLTALGMAQQCLQGRRI
jgi:hypothetical protein